MKKKTLKILFAKTSFCLHSLNLNNNKKDTISKTIINLNKKSTQI